ncbi:uncharacterized protein LOC119575378 [Penaeus monodon]|uniref:uncharacterized protein LOC119575378 n=1 Tax=Penaeus monodon TaxID=6687 RepID=UPI0018A6DDC3|nr:uncharacterized protein LOC119575378 [Penaeus monodon]
MTTFRLATTLCYLSVVQAVTGVWTEECKGRSRTEIDVENWPVNVAIKTPDVPGATFRLILSQRRVPVANLTFSHSSSHNDIVMMDLEIKFQQTPASSFLVFFASNTWNTVVLDWQKKSSKLMLSLSAPAGRVSYSIDSDFDVDLSQVDHVTASCIRTCVVDVDLECLAGSPATEVASRLIPLESHSHAGATSSITWAAVVLFVFMGVAVVLFLAWRHQHKKVKIQAHDVTARKRNTESMISNGSDVTQISVAQPRLQYSSILMSYDGPYSGSDEESSQGAACGGALPKTRNDYHRSGQACRL